ncbi:MAG TPA: ankyrin repeat domain-containing protein [Vicinamibacterales bacterium]
MRLSLSALAVLLAVDAGQPAGKIDFQHDVQPILNNHCVSCHGPELQMNGLRLDRRADALRGGTQTDIGPGNADGSRLYHRLIGTNFGPQMPPGRPLTESEVDIIKRWIDEGAEWPDEFSGEAPALPVDADASRLVSFIREGQSDRVDELLRRNPQSAKLRGPLGATPLMTAALYRDASLVKRLLASGADPNARNRAGATALMWAVPDVAKIQLLLDAGADVDARSEEGRSALAIASGTVGATPALTLLLDYGAQPWVLRSDDFSPIRDAARVGDVDMFRTLLGYGVAATGPSGTSAEYLRQNCFPCAELLGVGGSGPLPKAPPVASAAATSPKYDPGRSALPTPVGVTSATVTTIRAAVERSLPLLQDVDVAFIQRTGCVSCHHNSLVAMAVSTARSKGFAVNESIARKQPQVVTAYLETWRERALQNVPIAGGADTMGYLLFGLAAENTPRDAATDAQAIWLLRRQAPDGRWRVQTLRPPIESNDIEVTAVAARALQAFGPPTRRAEFAAAVDRARRWLTTAAGDDTDERAFRLLGLHWTNAPQDVVTQAAKELAAGQREDGGWSQTPGMSSDAYATGQALVALGESGAATLADRSYKKGIEFLLRTQSGDGTWFVESRAVPIQAYFESGFPYGVHQWVSAAATAWATTALALAR